MFRDPFGKAVPVWDHYWYYYYLRKCGESGIEQACDINRRSPEQMAQEAFNRGTGSISGLRFKVGYAENEYCRLAEYYSGAVFTDGFPTNVQRIHPNGELEDTLTNVAKTQKLGKIDRFWNWITSW